MKAQLTNQAPTAAAPAAPATDEHSPAYRRSSFGLWCLDLFEGMVRAPREASGIERFDQLGQAYQTHIGGEFAVSFCTFPLDGEETMVVEGLDHRIFPLDDLLLFTKTSEGFLDAKEELKTIRKRFGAIFVILKVALRFQRSGVLGFTVGQNVTPEGLKRLPLLLREDPAGDPATELKHLQGELKRRDIAGITFITQSELVAGGDMLPAVRVLLTLLKRGVAVVGGGKELETYAGSFAKIGGPAVISDLVLNLDHVIPGPEREAVLNGLVGGMNVAGLFAWRDALEKMGEELAGRTVRELDPQRHQALELKLRALPRLLQMVVGRIPPEELEKEAEKRREKFRAQQEAKVDQQAAQRADVAAAGFMADPQAFVTGLTGARDKDAYARDVKLCVDAFGKLAMENPPIARSVMEALLAHRKDASNPWRKELATGALRELGTERVLKRFLEQLASTNEAERELARVSLAAIGEPALPLVLEALGTAANPALHFSILKDMGDVAEAALVVQLDTPGLPAIVVRAGLQLLAVPKRPERFDLVSGFIKHADSSVREMAFRSAAVVDPARAQPLIKRHIGDRDVAVACTCLVLVGELRTTDVYVVKQLLDTLKRREKEQPEPDDRLQAACAKGLSLLGNFGLPDGTLEDFLLGLVKPEEKKLFGGSKFKDKSPAVKVAACEALGRIGGEKSVQALRPLAAEDARLDEAVKNGAREALRAISQRARKPQ